MTFSLTQYAEEKFKTHSIRRSYKRGEFLYREGETPGGIFLIVKGLVGLVSLGDRGNEHLLRLFKCAQYLGHRSLFAEEPYHASAVALEPCEVDFIPKAHVMRVLREDIDLAILFIQNLSRALGHVERRKVSFAEKDVVGRVAEAIVYLRELHPEHNWTRKEIADFCSSTTPTVIRVLSRFEKEGLLRFSKRRIEIVQKDLLLNYSIDSDRDA